jgi:DNA mismatch repair ATPase MutL
MSQYLQIGILTTDSNLITEVKFKEYGLKSVEVVDNGSGIAEEDYDSIGESQP